MEMARIYGVFPVPGDCHMVEYLPYTHNMHRKTWERYGVQMYPLDGAVSNREAMWENIEAMASGRAPLDPMKEVHSERVEKVIAAIATGEPLYEQALNLPNEGYITNLPEDAIVEIPAFVNASGPRGVGVGALPDAVTELVRRQITVVNLAVDAAVFGDRALALQALALDPMVDDLEIARNLLNDFLAANQAYVPQFFR
jgi:alpha-galactosidase